jgi:hypothetical protein
MGELNFITAQGISVLVNLIFTEKENKHILLMGVNNKIKESFNLLGFEGCCNFINDISEITKIDEEIFPINIQCPSCQIKMKIIKSGKFSCSSCKTSIIVNKKGEISL